LWLWLDLNLDLDLDLYLNWKRDWNLILRLGLILLILSWSLSRILMSLYLIPNRSQVSLFPTSRSLTSRFLMSRFPGQVLILILILGWDSGFETVPH